jgi:hypothetical protein
MLRVRRNKGMSKTFEDFFKDAEVISSYPLEQAIEDGSLVPIFKNRWQQLSGGKPIVTTAGIVEAFSLAAIREIWNEYVTWRKEVMPTLPEEDQLFSTKMNDQKVWVIEDGAVFTILFPSEY